MKRSTVLFIVISMVFFASSCSKYGYVTLNFPQAPLVVLSDDIHRIAVVNRSLTKEADKKGKIIEAVTTGEIAGSDKKASDECLQGVFDGMNNKFGYEIVIPQHSRIYGTGTREIPEVLDWGTVKSICDSANADVLLVLETFDSNSDVALTTAVKEVSSVLTGNMSRPSVPNQVKMNVKSYWRLYDPYTEKIIDQYQHIHYLNFSLNNGVPPLNALPQTAYDAGLTYSSRFLPTYFSVRRDLYKKAKGRGKQEFKKGYRKAEVANWQGAIETWTPLADSRKRKMAGKACLDIAVGYEVLGETDKAIEWANKAYEDYRDDLARSYSKVLLQRKRLEH